MAKRSFIWCPYCDKQNSKQELFTENPEVHLFRCQLGHVFEHAQLMALKPDMIKLEHHEQPGPHDIKAQVWVNSQVWQKFIERFPDRVSATMASIMQLCLDDQLIIISGEQAKKLKELGVTTGAGMVACAQERQRLAAENESISQENSKFWAAIKENVTA